jgi:hypothetical protein
MVTPPMAPTPDRSEIPPARDDPQAIVGELDAAERGFVLGVLLHGGEEGGAAAIAAALESPSRERCADALTAIWRLARAPRVRLTRALAHDVVPAFPAGIDEVDPSYLRAILDDEAPAIVGLLSRDAPPVVQAAITASLSRRPSRPGAAVDTDPDGDTDPDTGTDTDPTDAALAAPGRPRGGEGRPPEVVAEQPATIVMSAAGSGAPAEWRGEGDVSPDLLGDLRRAVLADIVAVPPAPPGASPRSWSRRLATLPGAELLVHLTWRGAEVLGLSLRGSAGEVLLRSAALVGAPFAERLLAVGRGASGTDADPDLDRGGARALVAATRPARDPRQTLTRLGARAMGARLVSSSQRGLGGVDVAVAVAQRLPPDVAAELLAAAGKPTQAF